MNENEILEKLKNIIAGQLNVEEDSVVPEANFIDDLGADSLDIVELVMSIEDEFEIQIEDADAENIVTVKDVIDYIKNK